MDRLGPGLGVLARIFAMAVPARKKRTDRSAVPRETVPTPSLRFQTVGDFFRTAEPNAFQMRQLPAASSSMRSG